MYYLLLFCLVPMVAGHYHRLDMMHHHDHHHHGHHPEHHHEHQQPEQIEQTTKPEVITKTTTATTTITTEQPASKASKLKIILDREDLPCQCVPYYLCSTNFTAVHANNASVTGSGMLDERSNASPVGTSRHCLYANELCCEPANMLTYKNTATEPSNEPDQTTLDPTETNPSMPNPPNQKPLKSCGFRNPKGLESNLVGITDKDALYGEFPWVVAVMDDNIYYGGGALIHPQVVITAAHVVLLHPLGNLKIRAGEWNVTSINKKRGIQEQLVKEVYAHPDLTVKATGNNIALLLLEHPVQLDEHINVICMPDQNEDFTEYKDCVANGWGKEAFSGQPGEYVNILKRVEIDMVENSRCERLLRTQLGGRFSLHSSTVCAGGVKGKDTCEGDGGSPLACPVGNNRYKLSGLVVAGVSCGQEDMPAVYSNVAQFRQWVDNKMAAWGLNSTTYTFNNSIESSLDLRNN